MDKKPCNKMRDIIDGLTIFARHGGKYVEPNLDILHAAQKDGEFLTSEEREELISANWFIDRERCDCDCDCDFEVEYEGNDDTRRHALNCNGWAIYT